MFHSIWIDIIARSEWIRKFEEKLASLRESIVIGRDQTELVRHAEVNVSESMNQRLIEKLIYLPNLFA